MTINERVSDERLSTLANLQSPECMALPAGHNEVAMLARELQQYRAAAGSRALFTCSACGAEGMDEPLESKCHCCIDGAHWIESRLYAAPQVTSVPDIEELRAAFETVERESRDNFNLSEMLTGNYEDEYTQQRWEAWLDCRAFITAPAVQAEQLSGITEQVSQPALPEGYALVPSKLTADNGAKGLLSGEFSETKYINCPECFGDDECETCDGSGRIEITVPVSWTTIKEIWAKGVEHFAAAPQQEAQEVKK